MNAQTVLTNVQDIAGTFARDRQTRQLRRELMREDFDQLASAGFLLTGVPNDQGGLWESAQHSVRPIGEILRALAAGDSSVALVASMHPSVLAFWLCRPQVDAEAQDGWDAQRQQVFGTAANGAWWGTITSEPGSGGDVTQSNTAARPGPDGGYRISGQKHFGSGSGNADYMVTTALPDGAEEPDWFFIDVRNIPWDGSAGMTLVAPWDGHGMIATQSHAMRFADFPATRFAWPGHLLDVASSAGGVIGCLFTAVIVGIVETAIATARRQLERKHTSLRAYEQVEWAKAELEGWLIHQAYEGMLRAVEQEGGNPRGVLFGKTAVAELASSALGRICNVVGGSTFGRQSPFGHWFEDVRALGFLRPPWGVAYDRIIASAWPNSA